MNILKYVNSRDVADYLEDIEFEFNAMQAAYVVYINDWLTICERIELWQQIINTMPDCEYESLSNGWITIEPSAHAAIESHIKMTQEDLRSFMSNDSDDVKYLYIPISSRWDKRPRWIDSKAKEYFHIEKGEWSKCVLPVSFSSFDRCIEYLSKENDRFERDSAYGSIDRFDRHRIGRIELDQINSNCYARYSSPEPLNFFLEQIILDGDYRPIRVKMGWKSNAFEDFVPHITAPFIQGDILIDATSKYTLPFVYDRCATWSVDEECVREAKDEEYVLVNDEECAKAILDRCNEVAVLYFSHGHMFVYGYEIDETSPDSVLRYNGYGACDNYLNLEYYRGSFNDGKLAVLPTVSWFVMNEIRDEVPYEAKVRRENMAEQQFAARSINRPGCANYDICSLVNAAFRLR